nr:hypothetical protein [uncultured Pseudomonas sp.]
MKDSQRASCKDKTRTAHTNRVLPLPIVPALDGDSLDLEKLQGQPLYTYIKFDGLGIGDELWPQFFGCGAQGEVEDRERTPLQVQELEPDGSFMVDFTNEVMMRLDGGTVFYSYAKTIITRDGAVERYVQVQSPRLLFYVNKPVSPVEQVPAPHVQSSDGLVIDLARVTGNLAVVTGAFPAMAVGDTVKLTWADEFYEETVSKVLKEEDLDRPVVWSIDRSTLELAGDWCEISYQVVYADSSPSDPVSQSPVQRLTILTGSPPQLPSLPPPQVQGDADGYLDPSNHPDGLVVEIPDYGMRYADEVLLHAMGESTQRASVRVDRTLMDSRRLRFSIPAQWLHANLGQTISLAYQWTRPGEAADSAALELTLRKPLILKLPIIGDVTPQDPEPPEQLDPDIEQYGFIFPIRLVNGANVRLPEVPGTDWGKVTMHWDGYGELGKYSTSAPVIGDNLRYVIPASAVPANLGRRVKVYYTVERADAAAQRSPIYGLMIRDWDSSAFQPVQCPDAPNGRLSLQAVQDEVLFTLSSDSWQLFDQGQIVRVWAVGKPKPEHASLPPEVIRDNVAISEDEYYEGRLVMALSKAYLEKLQENTTFEVYASVSFDAGDSFKSIVPADIFLLK